MRLRTGLYLLSLVSALLLTVTGTLLLPRSTETVYADNNLEQLCVPQRDDAGGGHFAATDWFRVAFINRATLKVQFVGTSHCRTPAPLRFPFIHNNGKEFEKLAGGDYREGNINDGFDYRRRGGGGSRDESRIDMFNGPGPSDPFDGKDAKLDDGQILNLISTSEFTFGIEEDGVGSGVTCSGENFNFTINSGDDTWKCVADVGSIRGYRIASKFSGFENFNITYNYQNGQVVHVSEGQRGKRTFSWCSGANGGAGQFRTEGCGGDLYLDGVTEQQMKDLGESRGEFLVRRDGDSRSFSIVVAGSESASAGATPGPEGDDASGSGPSCESEGGAVAWILCPVVRELIGALDSITKGPLQDLLRYDSLTRGTDDNPIFDVWRNFVRIANVLFIVAFMIIIFSQALSINIDAYTVRKMLPRVVIGIILVQLSYYMMAFMVDVFNVLGSGVAQLILAPIEGRPQFQALIAPIIDDNRGGAVFTNTFGGALLAANLGALITGIGGLLWAMVALLPTILFIILAVVVTLIMRKAVIAACIVFAPIALVAWILPNTDRIFKQWGELFLKTLFMYPLIMSMLAIGKFAGALIVADGEISDGGGDVFNTIAALIVNVIFYLFILLAYRFSDRILRGVGGLFLKARGFRGLGAAAAGGGGGGRGGGAPAGGFRGRLNTARARWAAGQGGAAQGRFNPLRMGSQKPKGWTLNPLPGFRPGQLRPRNLRADPRAALAGAFGGMRTPRQQWQRQRSESEGAAEEQFNMLVGAAGERLEKSKLTENRDAMEAIRLGKRGVALLRSHGRNDKANEVERLQQRYASLMRPEYQLAAATASLASIPDPDIDRPGAPARPVEESDAMIAYQTIADMFRNDPRRARTEVQKLALEAGKNGRHLQSTFAYDENALNPDGTSGRVRMVAGGSGPNTVFTDNRQEAMQNHVQNTSAGDLVRTHFSSAEEVAGAIRENLHTGYMPPRTRLLNPGQVRTTSAQQLGELLASNQLDGTFRRELEGVFNNLGAVDPALRDEARQTARNLGATI